jgi:transaldolase
LSAAVNAIDRLSAQGVSVWLDDLGRDRLTSGSLGRLVGDGVCGVTTNPSIFAAAVSKGNAYAPQLATLGGLPPEQALHVLMVDDVRNACDVLTDTFELTRMVDGRVSLEVDPRLAFDTEATIAAAKAIWADVDRPNVMVKIPATRAGLPAITETLASGISVNVTLIFGIERYREVQDAWLAGLEGARTRGHDVAGIGSVASFFVSRLDTAVDGALDAMAASQELGEGQQRALRGRAAVANARNAYRRYRELLTDPRWLALESADAQPQRPLWASTSAKDPSFAPTRYVAELVAPQTVNTMPSATLDAVTASDRQWPDAIGLTDEDAQRDLALFTDLSDVGIEYGEVVAGLEEAGVASFIAAWNTLLELVETAQQTGTA